MQATNYSAYFARDSYHEDAKEYFEGILAEDELEYEIEETTVENEGPTTAPFKYNTNFSIEGYADATGEFIYMNPVIFERWQENPFKAEKRSYPVDFPYSFDEIINSTITFPEGYSVTEVPKATKVALPNKMGQLLVLYETEGNVVKISQKVSLKETVYTPENYPAIRQFFDLLVKNHNSQIVLQKN